MNAPLRKSAPYIFYGQTTSLCETCRALVPAKIIIEGDNVFYQKRCHEHGVQKTLISTDAAYYKLCSDYIKPGDRPLALPLRVCVNTAAAIASAFSNSLADKAPL